MKLVSKLLALLFSLIPIISHGQQNENILYIVDSIPIIEEPKEGFGLLNEDEIDRIEVVKNKEIIAATGYENLDGIIYVFTKAYVQRPDSIKAIPTTKNMSMKNGTWFLKGDPNPYTGPFIDYYLNGKKQGDGYLMAGRLKGKRFMYHLNGNISDDIEYENGIPNGIEKRYYKDGVLMQKGELKNGVEIGVWEMYHPNGRLKQRAVFNKNGKMHGEVTSYYSTGKIKGKLVYENGNYQKDKLTDKIYEIYNQAQEYYRQGNFKIAIKKYSKCIELRNDWVDGYFARGTAKLNNFEFEAAIEDFDKAIQIEPCFAHAYSNRAFTIIRKYEFANSRSLSESNGVKVFATKNTEIPKAEINKIYADLQKAVSLGDDSFMVLEALKKFSQE